MIKRYIKKYFDLLEPKALFFIGFLLSYPLALIAANSIPVRLPIEALFLIGVCVWTILYFIKPLKSLIATLLLIVQYLWIFSLGAVLPPFMQDGFNTLIPHGTRWAQVIYDQFFGSSYAHFIYFLRQFLMQQMDAFDTYYYHIFVVFIFIAVMAIVMRLLEKRVDWKIFLLISSYFIVAWFIYVSDLKGYFSLYFIGLTVYRQYLIYDHLVEKAKGLGERTRYYNYTSAIIIGTIMMVVIVIFSSLVSFFIPMDKINDRIHAHVPTMAYVRNDFRKGGNSKIFSFSSTMYAPNDNMLGGKIIEREYFVVMRLKASQGGMYLRGRSKNIYDGSQWLTEFDTYYNNIYADQVIPEEHLDEIILYPETLATRTIFSPYLYYRSSFPKDQIYGNEDAIVYRKSPTNLMANEYTVRYIKPEFSAIYDVLKEEDRVHYLQLPDQGLTRTKGLVDRLMIGIEDPYEKMKILERYLREEYRYTLSTGEVDIEKDFVESFLFDEKQGYCTYFATSLAVMGRIADVPTRYVEGFISSDFLDFEGYYEVSANRAHAWTEAYIEGQGWVRFEATPAYLNGDEVVEETTFSDALESSDGAVDENPERPFFEEEGIEGTVKTNETIDIKLIVYVLFYILLVLVVTLIVVRKVRRLKRDLYSGDATENIHRRVLYLLSMCSIVDDEIDDTALPKVIIQRTSKALNLDVSITILTMIDQVLYSQKVFTEDEFMVFDAFFVEFEDHVKKKISVVTHFIFKMVLNNLYHRNYYL